VMATMRAAIDAMALIAKMWPGCKEPIAVARRFWGRFGWSRIEPRACGARAVRASGPRAGY